MAEIDYGIKAVETEYAGTIFRSRLEARWAAFFDILGWPWVYEPFDLDGWFPDFLLEPVHMGFEHLSSGGPVEQNRPVLVEVKPIGRFCPETAKRISNALVKSENELEPLLLGLSPLFDLPYYETAVGWLGEDYQDPNPESPRHYFEYAVLRSGDEIPGNTKIKADFCHENGHWKHRITGYYDGMLGGFKKNVCQKYWGEACNKVKYRPNQ
jgi:hypothetical protein